MHVCLFYITGSGREDHSRSEQGGHTSSYEAELCGNDHTWPWRWVVSKKSLIVELVVLSIRQEQSTCRYFVAAQLSLMSPGVLNLQRSFFSFCEEAVTNVKLCFNGTRTSQFRTFDIHTYHSLYHLSSESGRFNASWHELAMSHCLRSLSPHRQNSCYHVLCCESSHCWWACCMMTHESPKKLCCGISTTLLWRWKHELCHVIKGIIAILDCCQCLVKFRYAQLCCISGSCNPRLSSKQTVIVDAWWSYGANLSSVDAVSVIIIICSEFHWRSSAWPTVRLE